MQGEHQFEGLVRGQKHHPSPLDEEGNQHAGVQKAREGGHSLQLHLHENWDSEYTGRVQKPKRSGSRIVHVHRGGKIEVGHPNVFVWEAPVLLELRGNAVETP